MELSSTRRRLGSGEALFFSVCSAPRSSQRNCPQAGGEDGSQINGDFYRHRPHYAGDVAEQRMQY